MKNRSQRRCSRSFYYGNGNRAAVGSWLPQQTRRASAWRQFPPVERKAFAGAAKVESLACAAGDWWSPVCPGNAVNARAGAQEAGLSFQESNWLPVSADEPQREEPSLPERQCLRVVASPARLPLACSIHPANGVTDICWEDLHERVASCMRYPPVATMAPDGRPASATLSKCRTIPACIAFANPPLGSVTLDLPPWRYRAECLSGTRADKRESRPCFGFVVDSRRFLWKVSEKPGVIDLNCLSGQKLLLGKDA